MSSIRYNGKMQAQHTLFTAARVENGPLATRQGLLFGGQWGAVLIGPDISLPGGITINPPTAGGPIWDTLVGGGRPNITFTQDINHNWKRGHLVNGEWQGSGSSWDNLTPLTPADNANHKTVEQYMRSFCAVSLLYDCGAYRTHWYGIAYVVECSTNPWAAVPNNADLYAYAPEFIKVSWRAVAIPKPNLQAAALQNHLDAFAGFPTVPVLPFVPPARPVAIAGATVPVLGNLPGGLVFAYPGFGGTAYPAAQANGFDGDIEVHQS
jgi:hypothetical protein